MGAIPSLAGNDFDVAIEKMSSGQAASTYRTRCHDSLSLRPAHQHPCPATKPVKHKNISYLNAVKAAALSRQCALFQHLEEDFLAHSLKNTRRAKPDALNLQRISIGTY